MDSSSRSYLLPRSLSVLIEELGRLPGVGPRTAERYAYALLKREPGGAKRLAESIADLHAGVKQCPVTFALIDATQDTSPLYTDPDRNRSVVAVVEDALDVVALERTKQFRGTYHVLGGVISPIDGIGPEQLHIAQLLSRIVSDEVSEVILAMNASVEGESTAMYVQRRIAEQRPDTTVSRLARGIPMGVDLEYADQITLSHALEGRQRMGDAS